MIDTIRILTKISNETYEKIYSQGIIKKSFSAKTGEIFYQITIDNLEGSFSSSLYCRVYDRGDKYGFSNDCVIVIEGSVHKLVYGQNAYNGFTDLEVVVLYLKGLVENAYDIKLPDYKFWYIQRVDIAKCFDLYTQDRVCNYINCLSNLDFPRRTLKYYKDSCIYFTGTTTTLKIYNKFLEFKVHDRMKLMKSDFDVLSHEKKIFGLVRFECEIKKKKLLSIFENLYGAKMLNVRCCDFNYEILEKVWIEEFMKVLKVNYSDLKKVSDKETVKRRLNKVYGTSYGSVLYSFYLALVVDGCKDVRSNTPKTTYYRKLKELKDAGVDFCSNKISVIYNNESDFVDIFEMKEVC